MPKCNDQFIIINRPHVMLDYGCSTKAEYHDPTQNEGMSVHPHVC